MTTIAEAVEAQDIRDDRLFYAAESVKNARCLPDDAKAALIKHLSDARAKHPLVSETAVDGDGIAPTRPSKFSAAAAKVAKKASS